MVREELELAVIELESRLEFLIGTLNRITGGIDPSELPGLVGVLRDLLKLVVFVKTTVAGEES